MVVAKYKNILITGGLGFIGSHFTKFIINKKTFSKIIVVDKLGIGSNLKNLDLYYSDIGLFKLDICNNFELDKLFKEYKFDCVVNFAAESHVDRSLDSSIDFVRSNYEGVTNLLELSRKYDVKRFLQVSTDEVCFSEDPEYRAEEDGPYNPQNPYSVSKCAADMLCRIYPKTYPDLEVVVTRGSNTFGPNQYLEKMIPTLITAALNNKPLTLYGTGEAIRDYMYVEDHVYGIFKALVKGRSGEVYNLCSYNYRSGNELAKQILELIPTSKSKIVYVKDRPNHDQCYAISCLKATIELGFEPQRNTFETNLLNTIEWYVNNSFHWDF